MPVLAGIGGLLLILGGLWDGFETIVLPRRVTRQLRPTQLFYSATWILWSAVARKTGSQTKLQNLVSYFGPLSLIMLLGVWAISLIVGFALLQWALGSQLVGPEGRANFATDLYMSGTTFFTLGLGDVTPRSGVARFLTVAEAGVGFGFLALIISYLPALTSAFSQREVNVSLLDEWAGSPPTALELLRRNGKRGQGAEVEQFLRDWERWSAELMESHLSYPVLAYFRSQHENQSWVAALAMILDLCALVLVGIDGVPANAARRTFAMARHAAVDLTQVFNVPPHQVEPDRLPSSELTRLRARLAAADFYLRTGPEADQQLVDLRRMYEPYLNALAHHLLVALPPWVPASDELDNWQTTAWET
jgi:hypothetical protein